MVHTREHPCRLTDETRTPMVPGWRNRGRGRRHRSAVQATGADASFPFVHRWGFKSGQFMALEEIPPFQVDRVGARRSEHQRTVGPGGRRGLHRPRFALPPGCGQTAPTGAHRPRSCQTSGRGAPWIRRDGGNGQRRAERNMAPKVAGTAGPVLQVRSSAVVRSVPASL